MKMKQSGGTLQRVGVIHYITLPASGDEVEQVTLCGLETSGNCGTSGKGGETE